MPHAHLDRLAEILLRGGIAPRHVWRYINELSDHFDDLVSAARKVGASQADAEQEALTRIGAPEDLAQAMLAREDLKSFASKYPALTFGVAPVAAMAALVVIAVIIAGNVLMLLKPEDAADYLVPDGIKVVIETWVAMVNIAPPLLVGAGIVYLAWRQRIGTSWLMFGVAAVGLLGGFYDVGLQWPAQPGEQGKLTVGVGFGSPFSNLAGHYLHAAANIFIIGLPAWTLMRRHRRHA